MTRYVAALTGAWLWALAAAAQPAGTFDWAAADYLYPGVKQAEVRIETPRPVDAFAVRVELDTPGLALVGSPRADAYTPGSEEVRRTTTRDFMRQARLAGQPVVVALNANPWSPWPRPPGEESLADPSGLLMTGGQLVSQPESNRPAFILRGDGTAALVDTPAAFDTTNIENAVAGFSFCLQGGTPLPSGTQLAPRSGIGLTADGRTLILLAVDGRRHASQGATVEEVGAWLRYFGASEGINLDGGGSTSLAYWDRAAPGPDRAALWNRPVGNGIDWLELPPEVEENSFFTSERTVANSIGVATPFLEVTANPADRELPIGATFTLSVEVAGAVGVPSYTWRKDGVPLPDAPDAPALRVNGAGPADSGAYDVIVRDDYLEVQSAPAQVTIAAPVPVAGPAMLGLLALAVGALAAARRR